MLRRLRRVALIPRFARGVRALEYDITRYFDCTFKSYKTYSLRRFGKVGYKTLEASWHYWQSLHRDQEYLISTGEVYNTLVLALPRLQNVKVATLSDRFAGHRCNSKSAPLPPYPTRNTAGLEPEYQIHGYLSLIQAFASSSYRLGESAVYPEHGNTVGILIYMFQLSSEGRQWTKATFEYLTTVHFKFYTDKYNQPEDMDIEEILSTGVIAQVLIYATSLRRLSLTFHVDIERYRIVVPFLSIVGGHIWGSLEQIELNGIRIAQATELCDFLSRHRNMVTSITLRCIGLMDNGWIAVADCIRKLALLQGLLLEDLEVGMSKYLDCLTAMEIRERAMGGRHNNLGPDIDTILGALAVT